MTDSRAPIVVAVGASEAEASALLFASREALRSRHPLLVLHVLPEPGPRAARAPLVSYESATSIGRQLVVRAATRLQELTEGRVSVGTELVRGGAVDEVSQLSQSAHMVVLGHRNLNRVHRVFTGSVSTGVAARSSVEVVVVPEGWQPSQDYLHRVLVGVGNWPSTELFQNAFRFAAEHESQLKVLHAWELPSMYEDALIDAAAVEQWRHDLAVGIETAFADVARQHPAVKATVDVMHARPADALLEASRQADVLLLGRREVRHPLLHHLGSLTRAMLQVAERPVVVFPVA